MTKKRIDRLKLWQKPQDVNSVISHEDRKVSWLELFFDIFFVCAIAAVGHILAKDMTMHGFNQYVMTFIPVWWIWIGFSYYNERFETFGLENRVFTFLMMIPVAGMAIFAHDATHDTFVGFALSYALARAILGFLYTRAGYHIEGFKLTGIIYGFCFFLSVLIIVLSVFFASAVMAVNIFGFVLFFDLLVPFIVALIDRTLKEENFIDFSPKINERFGLFCIIVIGELVVAVISGISEIHHPSIPDFLLGLSGLGIGIGMWWIYFDFISRRGPDKMPIKSFLWTYLHMPLVMAFVALSAGLLFALEHAGEITQNARFMIGFSAGLSLITVGLLEWVSHRHKDEPTNHKTSSVIKFASGISLTLIVKLFEVTIGQLLVIILVFLLLNMAYGLWTWLTIPEGSEYETEYTG